MNREDRGLIPAIHWYTLFVIVAIFLSGVVVATVTGEQNCQERLEKQGPPPIVIEIRIVSEQTQ